MMKEIQNQLLSVSEAATILEVSRQRVLNLIALGTLQAQKIGNVYALSADSVRGYAATNRKAGRPPKAKKEK